MAKFTDTIVECHPHRWRLLEIGHGPVILCLHGAGASADSFRSVMEDLSDEYRLIAPDLPGHGQTRLGRRDRSGLPEMAQDIARLANTFGAPVHGIVGHSAGGALALQLDGVLSPRGQVLINPALTRFSGAAGLFFPLMARALTHLPLASEILAHRFSDPVRLGQLLKATGTPISKAIAARYAALAGNPDHIRGTLRMMAAWDLDDLAIPENGTEGRIHVLLATDDGTVPCANTQSVLSGRRVFQINQLTGGHLVHEAQPEAISALIRDCFA